MTEQPQKHRILFIDSGQGIGHGGPISFLFYLLTYLDKNKFEPIVALYFYNDGADTKKISSLGIPILFINSKKEPSQYVPVSWLLSKSKSKILRKIKVILRVLLRMVITEIPTILRLARLIRKENISLVVLNNDVHYHLAGTLGTKITGVPCICRKAGGIGEGKRIKRFLVPFVDLFIAISKATAEDQLVNNPSTKRMVMIYEGVDLKKYNPQEKNSNKQRELGISADKKVVGNISRFDIGKGQMELVEAAALIVNQYRDVIFLFVGDGELMNDLQTKTKRLNLTDKIYFTGWRNDIPEILSMIDIFVHCPTTWIEGLGIANLEALAMGKPSVVSDNGGLPDVVLNGVTGLVVPVGDVKKMSNAILELLEDEKLAVQLGDNARKRIEEEFDIEKNTKKLESLFEEYLMSP